MGVLTKQNPPDDSNISAEERRLNRLVFWSVLLMDYALAFGVGRQTTFRVEDITQTLPTEEDVHPNFIGETIRSPFPFAAKQMISYGPVINMLNAGGDWKSSAEVDLKAARAEAIKEYNQLPQDMLWNVGKCVVPLLLRPSADVVSLQRHSRVYQGSIFLHLHLWMHTIIASGYLTGTTLLRRSNKVLHPNGGKSGAATPNSTTASSLWRNSVRTIGDILVLSDIINPHAYFALPFVNQAFFVAGCCYVKGWSPSRQPR